MTVPLSPHTTATRSTVRISGNIGPVLLFGHGFCTDSSTFRAQVERLSEDHQVIT